MRDEGSGELQSGHRERKREEKRRWRYGRERQRRKLRAEATCGTTKTGKVGSNEKGEGGGRELRARVTEAEMDNRRGRVRSERSRYRGRRRVSREGGTGGGRGGGRGEVGAVRSHGSAATGKQTSEPCGHAYSCAYRTCVCVCTRVSSPPTGAALLLCRVLLLLREARVKGDDGRGERRARDARASVDGGLSCLVRALLDASVCACVCVCTYACVPAGRNFVIDSVKLRLGDSEAETGLVVDHLPPLPFPFASISAL